MENQAIFELADKLKALKQQKEELNASLKDVNKEIEALDAKLSDAMGEAEVDRFSRSGSTFYLKTRLFASPQAGKKDELISALRQNGYGDMVSETVNANTLASFCKEQMAESEDETLPGWLSDVVSTHEQVSVGIRKG